MIRYLPILNLQLLDGVNNEKFVEIQDMLSAGHGFYRYNIYSDKYISATCFIDFAGDTSCDFSRYLLVSDEEATDTDRDSEFLRQGTEGLYEC